MNKLDNYPDDIRRYDNDPRSPFYDEDTLTEQEQQEHDLNRGDYEYDQWRDRELERD